MSRLILLEQLTFAVYSKISCHLFALSSHISDDMMTTNAYAGRSQQRRRTGRGNPRGQPRRLQPDRFALSIARSARSLTAPRAISARARTLRRRRSSPRGNTSANCASRKNCARGFAASRGISLTIRCAGRGREPSSPRRVAGGNFRIPFARTAAGGTNHQQRGAGHPLALAGTHPGNLPRAARLVLSSSVLLAKLSTISGTSLSPPCVSLFTLLLSFDICENSLAMSVSQSVSCTFHNAVSPSFNGAFCNNFSIRCNSSAL